MSNFQMLLENENLIIIAEEVFKDSCIELIQNLDEESLNKIQEYVELLSNKKIKRSLENEISEALTPILEKNTILYGTFLYETTPIQENVKVSDKQMLTNIRENSRIDFIIEAMTLKEQAQSSKWKKAGKIGAGLGAAGLAGAAGLTALGHGDATEGFDKVKGAAGKVVKKVRDKFSDGPGDKTIMNSENARRTTLKAAQGSKYLDTDTGGNEATKLAPKSYGDQIKKLNSLNGLNGLNP